MKIQITFKDPSAINLETWRRTLQGMMSSYLPEQGVKVTLEPADPELNPHEAPWPHTEAHDPVALQAVTGWPVEMAHGEPPVFDGLIDDQLESIIQEDEDRENDV